MRVRLGPLRIRPTRWVLEERMPDGSYRVLLVGEEDAEIITKAYFYWTARETEDLVPSPSQPSEQATADILPAERE